MELATAFQAEGARVHRLLALFVDFFPILVITSLPGIGSTIGYFGPIPIFLGYRLCLAAAGRETWGKRTLAVRVVTSSGAAATRRRRIVRELPYAAMIALAWVIEGAGAIHGSWANTVTERAYPAFVMLAVLNLVFWDVIVIAATGRWSIHDVVAGTQVVEA